MEAAASFTSGHNCLSRPLKPRGRCDLLFEQERGHRGSPTTAAFSAARSLFCSAAVFTRAGPISQNPIPVPTPIPGSERESPILIPGIGLFQGGGSGPIPQNPILVPTPIPGKIGKKPGSHRFRFQESACSKGVAVG